MSSPTPESWMVASAVSTRAVASALMVESLPRHLERGSYTPDDLTLAVLRPDEAGQEPTEALDHLIGTCWHTYPMDGGAGTSSASNPTFASRSRSDAIACWWPIQKARVQTEAQQYFQGSGFKVRNWPEHANAVPDVAQFQLVLCRPRLGLSQSRPTPTTATPRHRSSGDSSMPWWRSPRPMPPTAPPYSEPSR